MFWSLSTRRGDKLWFPFGCLSDCRYLGFVVVLGMRPSFSRSQTSTFLFSLPASSPLLHRPRTLGKTLAAVATLGTGNSLGPEGPAVELGVASSRYVSSISNLSVQRQRMLLGAGAAAGVAAGFNAPIAGIFFALEIVKVGVVEGEAPLV